jgi:hypothetical protein
MTTKNQERTLKVSEKTYQALSDIAEQRYGNEAAITWSGLIYELCREKWQCKKNSRDEISEQPGLSDKTDLLDN